MNGIGDYITLAIIILGLSFVFIILWEFDHPVNMDRPNLSGKYIPNDQLPIEAVHWHDAEYFTKLTGRDYVKEVKEYNKKRYDKRMREFGDTLDDRIKDI